jgi:hypothetical protein
MKLFNSARKHKIDRIARQPISRNSVARNVPALKNLEADPNGAWKNDVSGNPVGDDQGYDPW